MKGANEMIRVYIASPYTIGDRQTNVDMSLDVAGELIELGYAPYAPLVCHYIESRKPQPYEKWLELDMEWLRRCHCVLRLPGESKGADLEVAEANKMGMPVFHSVEQLTKYPNEWSGA
jgi:hypothetical protein